MQQKDANLVVSQQGGDILTKMTLVNLFVKEQQNRVVVVGCQENKKPQNSSAWLVRRPCQP